MNSEGGPRGLENQFDGDIDELVRPWINNDGNKTALEITNFQLSARGVRPGYQPQSSVTNRAVEYAANEAKYVDPLTFAAAFVYSRNQHGMLTGTTEAELRFLLDTAAALSATAIQAHIGIMGIAKLYARQGTLSLSRPWLVNPRVNTEGAASVLNSIKVFQLSLRPKETKH